MSNSIKDHYSEIAFLEISEWNEIFEEKKLKQAVRIQRHYEPLSVFFNDLDVLAIWAFDKKTKTPLYLGWVSGKNSLEAGERPNLRKMIISCTTLDLFNQFGDNGLCYNKFVEAVKDMSLFKDDTDYIDAFAKTIKHKAKWCWNDTFSDIAFFVLKNNSSNHDELKLRSALAKVYDYITLSKKTFAVVPWQRIFEVASKKPELFYNFFFDPNDFNPTKPIVDHEMKFHWPWQRCMIKDNRSAKITLGSIPTVSIVGDLRHSTTAMSFFKPNEMYSEFLDKISTVCRNILLQNGAYFDKETGDGFVAHFCHSPVEKMDKSEAEVHGINLAIRAANEIFKATSELCNEYQIHLNHGIRGLRFAFGIHVDRAAWICDSNQIRAIGPSVVWAARLCSAAKESELLLSNRAYQILRRSNFTGSCNEFNEREVFFKEFKPDARLTAHSRIWGDEHGVG